MMYLAFDYPVTSFDSLNGFLTTSTSTQSDPDRSPQFQSPSALMNALERSRPISPSLQKTSPAFRSPLRSPAPRSPVCSLPLSAHRPAIPSRDRASCPVR